MDPFLDFIVRELKERHGCHTVVLYGSRARGEENPESDYDVLAFRDSEERSSDCREIDGLFLDAHIYPASGIEGREKDFRQLHRGRVLVDREGLGARLLTKVDEIIAKGPEPVAAHDIQLRRTWYQKTLKRIERGDAEGKLRRAMLLMNAIDDYFDFRRKWVMGPRLSFQWLREHDPIAYALFEKALSPTATGAELKALTDKIVEAQPQGVS
jgi:predicted nucleotidyltransferase